MLFQGQFSIPKILAGWLARQICGKNKFSKMLTCRQSSLQVDGKYSLCLSTFLQV